MDYSDLSPEEREIVGRIRQMSDARKRAITASDDSFWGWIQNSVRWVANIIDENPWILSAIRNAVRLYFGI